MRVEPMTTADILLRDILDAPDGDPPRLVLADWLEDAGDEQHAAQAWFIRAQVGRPP
jgi:uncharacterized protein (TIGR02996 family)